MFTLPNDRQIRNAFQTAIAIANYETNQNHDVVLGAQQFRQVANIARRFDEYLQNVYRGKNDAQLALDSGSRYDDFLRLAALQAGIAPTGHDRVAPVRISRGNGGRYGGLSFRNRTRRDDDSDGDGLGFYDDDDDDDESSSEYIVSERDSDEFERSKRKRRHGRRSRRSG